MRSAGAGNGCEINCLRKKIGRVLLLFSMKKKTFNTQDSRVVPHRSTDWAQQCLTSQFGWDAVYPLWFDRMVVGVGACNVLLRKNKFVRGKTKNIRHPRFPRGPPPQYWSGPMVLNFAVRMGCGVSTMVWSNDEPLSRLQHLTLWDSNIGERIQRFKFWKRDRSVLV